MRKINKYSERLCGTAEGELKCPCGGNGDTQQT